LGSRCKSLKSRFPITCMKAGTIGLGNECEQQLERELDRPIAPFEFIPRGNYFKGQGAEAADALRRHFGYEPNSVPSNVYGDFRKLGFHVFRRRLTNSNISGLTIRHPAAGTCILVNYDEDVYRQRFTASHEAAHGVLDLDQDVVVSFATPSTRDHLVEVRANTFAARYVLPPSVVHGIPVKKDDQNERNCRIRTCPNPRNLLILL
jgi:hypothetical protein